MNCFMLVVRVVAVLCFSRLYQRDHPSMDPEVMSLEKFALPPGCAQYYIAGKLAVRCPVPTSYQNSLFG